MANRAESGANLLDRARREGTPLLDGPNATFVWEGETAPRLVGDIFDGMTEDAATLKPLSAGLSSLSVELPQDAYIEYRYRLDGVDAVDPLNPRTLRDAFGPKNYFSMPAWEPTPLIRRRRSVPRGGVTKHELSGLFSVATPNRAIYLYHPPVTEPCPLLVVYDGNDYLQKAKLAIIVDNLIAQQRIRPIAMALLSHGNRARFVEYDTSEATLRFVVHRVLPLAREHLNIIDPNDSPGAYGVLGASMGGLMALYSAVRLPHLFGQAISQSGAFGLDLGSARPVLDVLLDTIPPAPIRIWMDIGAYDFLLEANRRMYELLARRGYDVIYREYSAAHNYTGWRNDVWRGLEAAFPPATP